MAVKKLLDENSLNAIKTYVDTQVGKAGKVDDVKINSTSVVASKVANIAVDGTYNSSSNKVATQTTVSNAIGALDVSNISGFGAGKTLATLTETDGKIAATFQNITITESQVTNLTTDLATKVPTSRTIAGLALSSNITSASLITALGLTQALVYIGVATTTKPSAGNYVQTVIGSTTYYVSLTSSGTATQVNAQKGQILTIGSKEYICTTAGASGTNVFSELGDESSYALKTITISSGSGLSGGGDLSTNRTISHAVPTGAATKSSGFYKFSTDGFGHVNGTTAVAKADLTGLGVADDSAVVHIGTSSSSVAETIYGNKTFSGNNLIVSASSGAPAIKLQGSASGWAGTTTLQAGTPGGNDVTITLPSSSGTLVLGASSATDGNIAVFDGTTGKLIKDGGTSLSTVTSHINNSNIHVTSANKTAWNGKVADVRVLEVEGATENDNYQKFQQSKDSGSTYSDIVSTLSYNEILAILQGE